MEKEFVPYEQSLELKELGFNEPCFGYYDTNEKLVYNYREEHEDIFSISCVAPIYQQVFRWFREKNNLYPSVEPTLLNQWDFAIFKISDSLMFGSKALYIKKANSYEEAQLACLTKLIEIVKNK